MSDIETQAPRTERTGVMLTPHEKAAVRFVAAHRRVTESNLLRGSESIDDIVADYERLQARLAEVA